MDPLELPPGVYNAPTKASKSANYSEANLMRWNGDKLKPVGGWEIASYNIPFASRIRAIHSWLDNNGVPYIAYLCEQNLYVDAGGVLTDISPTVPLTPPYAGDIFAGGYGDDLYSLDTYGTPRPTRPKPRPVTPSYTLDNWGEQLLIMTSADGRLLFWDPTDVATVAEPVENAPLGRTFVVTAERHVMIFGAEGNFRRFAWSDQENYTNWDYASLTSKAGFYDVEPASPILMARVIRDGILFMTAAKVYLVRSIGLPYIYSYEPIFDAATPISAAVLVPIGAGAVWMSDSGFWTYDGASVSPVPCGVWNWITDDYDPTFIRYEAAAVNNTINSEYWFFFPAKDSRYNSKYVIYNYRDRWWSMGILPRSAGYSATFNSTPIIADGDLVYFHESGNLYPNAPELPWIKTFMMNIGSGASMMTINQLLPDLEGNFDELFFQFEYKDDRSRGAYSQSAELPVRPNGYVDVRLSGRDFRMKIGVKSEGTGVWTMGQTLIDTTQRGKR